MIDLKASIKHGERLKAYNAWNKEMPVAVKGVGGQKDALQLPPMVRLVMPIDQLLTDKGVIHIDQEAAVKKGLALVTSVQLVGKTPVNELYIKNVSDSLVTIANGDILAQFF